MFLIFRFIFFYFCFADYLIFLIIFSCYFLLAFLAHFPIGKEAIVRTLSICPSVTASSLQGVNQGVIYGLIESLWAKDLNYGEKKILGIDPGRGQEDLKSWTLKIFFEYLWTFYKCVWVRKLFACLLICIS